MWSARLALKEYLEGELSGFVVSPYMMKPMFWASRQTRLQVAGDPMRLVELEYAPTFLSKQDQQTSVGGLLARLVRFHVHLWLGVYEGSDEEFDATLETDPGILAKLSARATFTASDGKVWEMGAVDATLDLVPLDQRGELAHYARITVELLELS